MNPDDPIREPGEDAEEQDRQFKWQVITWVIASLIFAGVVILAFGRR